MPTATTVRKAKAVSGARIVGNGVVNLDSDEQLAAMNRLNALQERTIEPGDLMLFDPIYPRFAFGPYGAAEKAPRSPEDEIEGGPTYQGAPNIQFEDGVWVGPDDHPRIAALLRARPDIITIRGAEDAAKVFACLHCEVEVASKAQLIDHTRAAHKES